MVSSAPTGKPRAAALRATWSRRAWSRGRCRRGSRGCCRMERRWRGWMPDDGRCRSPARWRPRAWKLGEERCVFGRKGHIWMFFFFEVMEFSMIVVVSFFLFGGGGFFQDPTDDFSKSWIGMSLVRAGGSSFGIVFWMHLLKLRMWWKNLQQRESSLKLFLSLRLEGQELHRKLRQCQNL